MSTRIAMSFGTNADEYIYDDLASAEQAIRDVYAQNELPDCPDCHGEDFLNAVPDCEWREIDTDTDDDTETMIAEMTSTSLLRIPYGYDIDITPRTSPRYEYTDEDGNRIWVQYFDGVGDPGGTPHNICLYYKESPDYDGHNPETAIDRREPYQANIDGLIYKF